MIRARRVRSMKAVPEFPAAVCYRRGEIVTQNRGSGEKSGCPQACGI
jgi:hypothetical protein